MQLLGTNTFSTFSSQGWGIITDGTHLIVSDGSATLNIFEFPEEIRMQGGDLRKVPTVAFISSEIAVIIHFL